MEMYFKLRLFFDYYLPFILVVLAVVVFIVAWVWLSYKERKGKNK